MTDREMNFRALLVKLQDRLSDSDRRRLHFLFRHIIPRRIVDDPSINGTLSLLESLFDCGKISDQDFDYLIEAFREIGCYNIVRRLEAHAQDLQLEKNTVQSSLLERLADNTEEDKIRSITLSLSLRPSDGICAAATWVQNATTVAGGNISNQILNRLNSPFGIFIDVNQTIYVVDSYNNRVVKWNRGASSGKLVAGRKGYGSRNDQLGYPYDVVVDRDGTMYISDTDNRRVQRWSPGAQSGQTFIKNISARGIAQDDQGSLYVLDWEKGEVKKWRVGETTGKPIIPGLNQSRFLFVDQNRSVYVTDPNNHRVIKVYDGTTKIFTVAGGSYGNGTSQLAFPSGVTVDQSGTVYVADTENHRIMRWPRGAIAGNVIVGGHGAGGRSNQLHSPNDISFDQDGNLYVVDHYNDRVQKFAIDKSSC